MTLGTAAMLLLTAAVGFAASALGLKRHTGLRLLCMIVFALVALACAVYLGLGAILLNAAQNKPPLEP